MDWTYNWLVGISVSLGMWEGVYVIPCFSGCGYVCSVFVFVSKCVLVKSNVKVVRSHFSLGFKKRKLTLRFTATVFLDCQGTFLESRVLGNGA